MGTFTVFLLITKQRIFPWPRSTYEGLNPNSLDLRLPRSCFPARSCADSLCTTFVCSSLPKLPTNFQFQVIISLLAISLFASLQTECVDLDHITMNILIPFRIDKVAQTLTKVNTITIWFSSLHCVCCSVVWTSCSWDPFVCIVEVILALK